MRPKEQYFLWNLTEQYFMIANLLKRGFCIVQLNYVIIGNRFFFGYFFPKNLTPILKWGEEKGLGNNLRV